MRGFSGLWEMLNRFANTPRFLFFVFRVFATLELGDLFVFLLESAAAPRRVATRCVVQQLLRTVASEVANGVLEVAHLHSLS